MNSRNTAIVVGILFITATVTYMIGSGYLDQILNDPDYLTNVSAKENLVLRGMLLELVNHLAVICIPFMMYPILRKQNEALALGYSVFRTVESLTLIIGSISLLSLLTLSQEYVRFGAPDLSHYLTMGSLLVVGREWTVLLGVNIVFSLGSLIFNYLLYKSEIVPKWLSVWGFIGAALLLPRAWILLFSENEFVVLTLAIWVQEMVFAAWLIVKGFNPSAITSLSATTVGNEI